MIYIQQRRRDKTALPIALPSVLRKSIKQASTWTENRRICKWPFQMVSCNLPTLQVKLLRNTSKCQPLNFTSTSRGVFRNFTNSGFVPIFIRFRGQTVFWAHGWSDFPFYFQIPIPHIVSAQEQQNTKSKQFLAWNPTILPCLTRLTTLSV